MMTPDTLLLEVWAYTKKSVICQCSFPMVLNLEQDLAKEAWVSLLYHLSNGVEVSKEGGILLFDVILS